MRTVRVLLLAFAVIGVPFANSQVHRALQITQNITVHHPLEHASPIIGKCDASGNLYLPELIDSENFGPVLRLSADASMVNEIVYSGSAEETARMTSFTISRSGETVYLAGVKHFQAVDGKTTPPKPFLATFDRDAKQIAEVGLDPPVLPLQMASLVSGQLLIAGLAPAGKDAVRDFLGVYRTDGRLEREVKLPPGFQDTDSFSASVFSFLEMSDDGMLFLMRAGTEGPVHVISPEGELIQSIRITAPPGTRLLKVKAARDRLVALTGKVVPTEVPGSFITTGLLYSVVNPHTGEFEAQYDANPPETGVGNLFGNLVCYASETFTFLARGTDGRISLVRAEPR